MNIVTFTPNFYPNAVISVAKIKYEHLHSKTRVIILRGLNFVLKSIVASESQFLNEGKLNSVKYAIYSLTTRHGCAP